MRFRSGTPVAVELKTFRNIQGGSGLAFIRRGRLNVTSFTFPTPLLFCRFEIDPTGQPSLSYAVSTRIVGNHNHVARVIHRDEVRINDGRMLLFRFTTRACIALASDWRVIYFTAVVRFIWKRIDKYPRAFFVRAYPDRLTVSFNCRNTARKLTPFAVRTVKEQKKKKNHSTA